MELSLASQILFSLIFLIFGIAFGSFGNVLILRLPQHKLPSGRSQCMSCKHTLNFIDLIPVLGFIARGGKCHYCKASISWQYPIIELLSGLLFVIAIQYTQYTIITGILLSFCFWLLLLISLIDWRIKGIPDLLSFPFIIVGISYGLLAGTIDPISIAIGVGFLGVQWLLSGGTWVGSGDIVLMVGIGAIVGVWPLMIVCMFGAYILGAIVASYLLLSKKRTRKDALAFGPFLATSTLFTMLYGTQFLASVYGIAL